MGNFERVEARRQQPSDPTIRVTPDRPTSYISVGAIRRWFEDISQITFYVDRDESSIALVPEDGEHSYKLKSKSGGASIATKQALRDLGVEVDDISKVHVCPLEKDRDSGYVVADVSDVVEDATDDVHCPECGVRFTEHGVKSHLKTVHGESKKNVDVILQEMDPDDLGEATPDGDDSWKDQYDRADEAEEASSG